MSAGLFGEGKHDACKIIATSRALRQLRPVKFLPIAERELRVASRRRATYWLRFSMPGGLLVLAAWVFLANQRDSQRETGMMIFYVLTGGLTLYALTSGMRSTADSLAEEKRDGTLGLLFLTD